VSVAPSDVEQLEEIESDEGRRFWRGIVALLVALRAVEAQLFERTVELRHVSL